MFSRFSTLLLAATALVPLGLAPASANPQGPQVVSGSATIQDRGKTVTITQTTDKAIINWNTFNIGPGEITKIFMPNSNSVQLDRVTGGLGPSQILGSLWSNGRVFLVNPDGILFGAGAKVDTAGFLATTNDIKNADFMAGRYNFSIAGRPDASIVNQGTITARNGGFAALVAPGVRNSGTISATLGTVALASGNSFTLDLYGDKLITLGVNDSIAATVKDVVTGQPLDALVKNEGTLKANGGRVELTAAAARMVVDSVINNTGVIEANTIGQHNGMIVISAATVGNKPAGAPTQTVKISGKLSAAGQKKGTKRGIGAADIGNNGTKGGTVVVTGENIVLTGAKIDASGPAGGGKVLIGGDTGGGNPSSAVASIKLAALESFAIPTASSVSIDAATTIDVSATAQGNGGKVIVWSDQQTSFAGSILARGGPNGGNGGFVETSGHTLDFTGARVDTSAPKGKSGLWLLDPFDLTIDAGAASTIATNLATTDVSVQTTASGFSGPGNATSGSGDIIVNSNISWGSANSLTLSAYRNIMINANIANIGGHAGVTLRADNFGTGVGTVSFDSGKTIFTTGGVSIFYNPSVNPAGSLVNAASYVSPTENYTGNVTGGGTLTAYMLVNTVYDLQNIQNNLSGTYALGKNIDASVTTNWNGGAGFQPIGNYLSPFGGLFDGQGLIIDKLSINSAADYVGLFGSVGLGGKVKNLGLTNELITVTPNAGPYVGGLVGENRGTIANSYVTGTITGAVTGNNVFWGGGLVGQNDGGQITQSYSTASLLSTSPNAVLGGLVGNNNGTISESYATGAVSVGDNSNAGGLVGKNSGTITKSYATGAISASTSNANINSGVGGLVGSNGGTISQSYATGNVIGGFNSFMGGLAGFNSGTNAAISQSYATGNVTGGSNASVGGLVGWNQFGSVTESYATGAVTGGSNSNVGGLVGQNNYGCTGPGCRGGSIDKSYATGAVTGGSNSNVGGLVGFNNTGPNNNFGLGSVTNSYWDIQTTGQIIGIAIDSGGSSAVFGLTSAQARMQASYTTDPTIGTGWDFVNIWAISPNINNGYPYLINNPPPVLTPPTPLTQPSLPPGFTDVFGNQQTNAFNFGFDTRVAGSTPSVIKLGSNAPMFAAFYAAITQANETGISYVKNDPQFKQANDDVKKAILGIISGGFLTAIFDAIDFYEFAKAVWNRDAAALTMILDQALQAAVSKYSVPGEWEFNKLIGVVIRDYVAGFVDSIMHSITGAGCTSLAC